MTIDEKMVHERERDIVINYDNKKECALCDYWRIYTNGIHKCSLEDRNCPYDKNKEGDVVNDD